MVLNLGVYFNEKTDLPKNVSWSKKKIIKKHFVHFYIHSFFFFFNFFLLLLYLTFWIFAKLPILQDGTSLELRQKQNKTKQNKTTMLFLGHIKQTVMTFVTPLLYFVKLIYVEKHLFLTAIALEIGIMIS